MDITSWARAFIAAFSSDVNPSPCRSALAESARLDVLIGDLDTLVTIRHAEEAR
jgi:hypothetical protein